MKIGVVSDRSVPSSRARILVVEDSDAIRESVVDALDAAGYQAEGRSDGDGLEDVVDAFRPDLLILDVMLPGRDGFALVPAVRQRCDAGIVLLTARDALQDRLRGLDGGADDYVVKPFLLAELVSRVGAVLRRRGRESPTLQLDDLVLDVESRVVSRGGRVLDLTATELRLLSYLVAQRNRTVSKSQILTAVWGYDAYDHNLVEVYVSSLRRKMGEPRMLHTVRGLGYSVRVAG